MWLAPAQLAAKLEAKKAVDERRTEVRNGEKKTFANAPTGRFVSSSVGGSNSYRPEKSDGDIPASTRGPSSAPAISAVNTTPPPPPKKKFFGLF